MNESIQEGGTPEDRGLVAIFHEDKVSCVLTATVVGVAKERREQFYVAGPAVLHINPPPADTKVFFTYRVAQNGD